MKKKSFNKMLQLNKSTIATLEQRQMGGLIGGNCTFSCDTECLLCNDVGKWKQTHSCGNGGTCGRSNYP